MSADGLREPHSDKLIIGIGNRMRGDDGAGLEVSRLVRLIPPTGWTVIDNTGDPALLLDIWASANHVIAVDAVVTQSRPAGTIQYWDIGRTPLAAVTQNHSSHALGLAEAAELARALGQLPRKFEFLGIEAENFDYSEQLTPVVAAAVGQIVKVLQHAPNRVAEVFKGK